MLKNQVAIIHQLQTIGGEQTFHFLGLELVGVDGRIDCPLGVTRYLIDLIDSV